MKKVRSDTPAMIRFCLNCPWPECIDCLGMRNAYGWAIRNYFEFEVEAEPPKEEDE